MIERRRLITTMVCFHGGIRAARGGERSRRGTGGSYCSAARGTRDGSMGPPRLAPPACARRESEPSQAAAAARRCRCRRDACGCRWQRFVEGDGGREHVARPRACVREETGEGPGSPSAPISGAHVRSNARERSKGGRYFIYRPPRCPIRPAPLAARSPRRAVEVSTARPT